MVKVNDTTTSAINSALRKIWYKICCLVKRVEVLEEGGSQSLQEVVNVENTISNFGGIHNASIQSTNFINGRTLLLNDNSAPAIKIIDNANASNYLQIDTDTLNIDGVSYNWSSIVNPPSSPLAALPFTTDHLAITNNEYAVGDLVYYGGNVYRCIANNDSLQPDLAPAYWANLGAGFPLVQQPVDWNSTSGNNQILNKPTIPVGTVTSVGLSMPPAFTVANSPVTGADTLTVTGAGLATQYVRGDGQLANFPSTSGGGSSVAYYLNGSVSQGTFGGNTYYELSKTPVFGGGTNFTRTEVQGDGYIASFITDAGDPSLLSIPAGNWTLEFYFNASSNGGNPRFYGELYKVDSSNVFTLIASESANPEFITNGTNVDQYFTSISVPQTTLLITDRIAIRIYVIPSARDITLHTENTTLSEVLTTFSTGLTALNGLTEQVQFLATGTSGTDFGINSTAATHTFNLPTASATNRGALSSADWSAFNNKIPLAGTINAAPITGRLRTTNDTGVWKEFSVTANETKILTTGVIAGAGANGTPSTISSRAIFKGDARRFYDGDAESTVEYSQSLIESASRLDYFGAITTARIYAESYTIPNFTYGYSRIVVDAGDGLIGAADYTAAYGANSFVQKSYVDSKIPTLTSGFVAFSDGTTLTGDSQFQWNNTSKILGIGNPPSAASSILDIQSSNRGVLIPRMSTINRNNIASPATGLRLFDTTLNAHVSFNGTNWQPITPIIIGGNNYNSLISTGLTTSFSGDQSIVLGSQAGVNSSSSFVIFLGPSAGNSTNNAQRSIFIGNRAGQVATNAEYSNFIGYEAGNSATNASYSNFLGYQAGKFFTANNLGTNNIIIGTNISLPNATTNSINIGNVIYGVNTYGTTTGNPSVVPTATGRIGVGVVTPTANLHIKASTTAAALMRLTVGPAPTSPNDGDIWLESNTQTGLKIRLAGVTRTFSVT